jgi:hypothetical protein
LQTKQKLAGMEARLKKLRERTDLDPRHYAAVERSYLDMIRQYRRDIKLYEFAHGIAQGADIAVSHDQPSATDQHGADGAAPSATSKQSAD